MNYDIISPYVRRAMHCVLKFPYRLKRRIILDYELIFIENGCCKITVGDTSYECYKNDVIFLRPGVEHVLESLDEYDFSQPHVHFDIHHDEYSERRYVNFKKFNELPEDDKCLLSKDMVDIDIPTVIRLKNPEYFKAQLFDLIESFGDVSSISRLRVKALMTRILLIVFENYDKSYAKSSDSSNEMTLIKSYIESNCTQKITLDSLSSQFFMSKFYIEVNFKKCFGVSVIKYYNQCRLRASQKMILEGKRVGDISRTMNFDNIYSFSRFFKNALGISPSEYKNQNLRNK